MFQSTVHPWQPSEPVTSTCSRIRASAARVSRRQRSASKRGCGIGTLFTYASKGRREFPNETFYVDGAVETLSKAGGFVGRHICVPLEGVGDFLEPTLKKAEVLKAVKPFVKG